MTRYGEAGVDLEAGQRHVDTIAPSVTATWGDRVVGGFGGFAAGVEIPPGYTRPVLMMSTDGVGTKLDLARRADSWDGVGFDLVAMCVDDLAAVGAAPLGLVDYMAVGSLRPDRDAAIVASIADACAVAGCPLLGGETAEHPGVMPSDSVDLAGSALGVVEMGGQLGPDRVGVGDQVIALASPNLRSNGYSLVRSLFAGAEVDPLLGELLAPSVIYSPAVMAATATGAVHAAAHITGGGLPGNLTRALPEGLGAVIDTDTWQLPQVFVTVASRGVERDEMFATFNMGIGFCLIVAPAGVDEVMAATSGHSPWRAGEVVPGSGVVLD